MAAGGEESGARPESLAGELREEVARLAELEREHAPIVARLEADRGMAPETRRELLEHLREEEREHRDRIAGLRGALAAREGAGGRRRLTVGSLRRDPEPPRGGLGSLRRD